MQSPLPTPPPSRGNDGSVRVNAWKGVRMHTYIHTHRHTYGTYAHKYIFLHTYTNACVRTDKYTNNNHNNFHQFFCDTQGLKYPQVSSSPRRKTLAAPFDKNKTPATLGEACDGSNMDVAVGNELQREVTVHMDLYIPLQLPVECHLFSLKSQSLNLFSVYFAIIIEKRLKRSRFDIEIE